MRWGKNISNLISSYPFFRETKPTVSATFGRATRIDSEEDFCSRLEGVGERKKALADGSGVGYSVGAPAEVLSLSTWAAPSPSAH